MISELLQEIANRINENARRVVIANDPDGLLASDVVRSRLEKSVGFPVVVVADGLSLRVHFELNIRRIPDARICYVTHGSSRVLNDIGREAKFLRISIAELFPNFVDRSTMRRLDFETLESLYAKHIQGRVTAARLQSLIEDKNNASEPIDESAIETLRRLAESPDWSDTEYVEKIGKAIKCLIAERSYDDFVVKLVDDLNFDFQHYLQDCYFPTLNSAGGPRAVNAVIPFIRNKFDSADKVAFVVVDGMAWWQWEVLRDVLEERKIVPMPEVRSILAWLPSITALSRQALFRGAAPLVGYTQSPKEEEKLWKGLWQGNPLFRPIYQHDVKHAKDIDTATRRLALVDVMLDKKMHQSSDYYDLHDLTHNWAFKFSDIIALLRKEDFKIVLTTDHGNVLAKGTGMLKPQEKVHLYLANSKGERFVYFNSRQLKNQFLQHHAVQPFFSNPKDNWLAMADNSSFSSLNKQLITHGGSHFMETVIPLIMF